jgi:hypothetical protein
MSAKHPNKYIIFNVAHDVIYDFKVQLTLE